MRFAGQKEEVAIKRTILGCPDSYTEYKALKKQIEVPEPVKKSRTHGLGLTPKSLLGHSNISASHSQVKKSPLVVVSPKSVKMNKPILCEDQVKEATKP